MTNNETILLTGASGFVGGAVFDALSNYNVILCGRTNFTKGGPFFRKNINECEDYSEPLNGVSIVIHCAARAHVTKERLYNPLDEYRAVNVGGTLNLARQAAAQGVKRFIFISSIKVNGESTSGMAPFRENDNRSPTDPYGISKFEAEQGLKDIADSTGMEVVIIRPPLIYGPGVKANFLSLMKLAVSPIPLPFGAINNARSMIYIGNLIDFIVKSIEHPKAANQIFIISDGEDVSLSSLVRLMRKSIGRSTWQIPIPKILFEWIGTATNKRQVMERLIGSLQVDPSKAQSLLDWKPPFSVSQGIEITMQDFIKGKF
ncbi:SDR family oxidoreductase [Simiduia litorea]|uniref:UDP-glucose 4-epimerase family protein n=1 Tax=Simiduia litorea TaxID=1435348 RepID=UPI0036F1AFA5